MKMTLKFVIAMILLAVVFMGVAAIGLSGIVTDGEDRWEHHCYRMYGSGTTGYTTCLDSYEPGTYGR
jgi:hypothetical protein